MTKKLSLLIILSLIICNVLNVNIALASVKATSIKLNDNRSLYLEVGDIKQLDVTIFPADAAKEPITYKSGDEHIVSVSASGLTEAVKTGTTSITATMGDKKSTIFVTVYTNNNIQASFKEADLQKGKAKNITINVSAKDGKSNIFYIYLPSGFMIQSSTATFAVDRNGTYPFTVYDNTGTKKTFYYDVKGLTDETDVSSDTNYDPDEFDLSTLISNLRLQYDYEKKQLLLNAELDKVRNVVLPNNTKVSTNEINYYISTLKNSVINNYAITVDNKTLNIKVIKQGEYYLLITWQTYKNHNNTVMTHYKAYNFVANKTFYTNPTSDFITDNGNFEIEAYSNSGQRQIFTFALNDIDYVKPYVSIGRTYEDLFEVEIIDNMSLDHLITYDGKYVDLSKKYTPNTQYFYKTTQKITYNGDYMFTVVDKSGNRTNATCTVAGKVYAPYARNVGTSVHNTSATTSLFADIGRTYENNSSSSKYFDNIFPSYMNGTSSTKFSPKSTITRAQMVAILCRITDINYDISLLTKCKFTDITNHWAKYYIAMGSSKKYISGYKDNTFKPNGILTRGDFCVMINNISALRTNLSKIPAVNNYSFKDINGHYAKDDVLKLANRDLIKGTGNYFYPDTPITRAEVVHTINKLYGLTPSDDELNYIKSIYNNYYNFTDISGNKYYNDIIISIVGMYRQK